MLGTSRFKNILYLVWFNHKLDQVLGQVPVLLVEEGGGETEVSHAAGTTDPVNVFVDVRGKIEIDDVFNVGDVKTTCGNLNIKKVFLFEFVVFLAKN